ncbi:MAG: glutamine-synthetase adenylyltransferase, partial [Alphaproteobacteria bacterium]|nr:glutamine-synthetase adenylyltransferase [Alphaproteobacteria bacterium]
ALAAFAGHSGVDAFAEELRRHLECVEQHYARLFEDAPPLSATGNLVFTGGEDDPETLATIAAMGFANPAAVSSEIRGWHHGRIRATRSTRAREMLTEITPALLAALARTANPEAAFLRMDDFLTHLPLGVPVFSLLYQNPPLLDLLAEIMGNAPRLADHLARHPQILDAVLTQGFFAPPPEASDLDVDLDRVLAAADDYQEVLDLARRWANDQKFRVGVQVLHGKLSPEAAAGALSDIADSLLSRLHPRVEAEFARNHGRVPGDGAVIVAMGKLGSREMTASSDLDLILIYDAAPGADVSDGPKPLSPMVYFARLTQRLINALTLKTAEGFLYEVDMRLRPSGHAGPIATSFDAFKRYHEVEAWTWEHMALTRARPVSGAPHLVSRIETVIRDTLTRPRDPATLLRDVSDMRERMAREHKGDNPWEVKPRRGGLVDIEFIAQYLQLRHAHQHPDLLHHGAGRVFETAATLGLLDSGHAATLVRALRLFSAVQGVLRQTVSGAFRERTAPAGLTELLARTAGEPDFDSLKARMESTAAEVLSLFHALIDEPARRQETTP